MPIPEGYHMPVPEKKEYELLPDDSYQVKIAKIELRENQPVFNSTEVEDKFSFEFVIVEDGLYKGRKLWQDMRTIMSAGSNGYSPSWLYKLFTAVNNVKLNDEDVKSVTISNINEMLGREVRLVVKQEKNRKGELKNKIKDMLPLKGMGSNTFFKPEDLPQLPEVPSDDDINVDEIPF